MVTSADFVRLLLDPVRLAVAGDAVSGGSPPDELAARLGVPLRDVLEARSKLQAGGLMSGATIDKTALLSVAQSLPKASEASPEVTAGPWSPAEAEILSRFFSGGRLESIPMNRTKRLIVLERLAQEFEPGLRYEEADVNFRLQLFHSDYAALRRYLVDEGIMTRADGVYWRTGGRFVEDAPPEHDG